MQNLPKVVKIINVARQARSNLSRVNDKYSSMFLLVDMSNKMYIAKKDGKDELVGNKALASRFTLEAAKKEKERLNRDLAIVDEVSEVVVNDSKTEDSPASEVVSAIKRQYPQVTIQQFFVKKGDHDVFKLRIDNAPGVDRFDHTKKVSFERFVEHLLNQNNFKYVSVFTNDTTVYADGYYDKTSHDSCKDDIDTSKLTLEEARKLYDEGKISLGQLDDVAIRLNEEKKKSHDELEASDIDDLIAEEYNAIADYEAAIAECKSEAAKAQLQHILDEEKEHVKELEALKERGVKTMTDIRDGGMRDYVYGIQHPNEGQKEKRHTLTPNQKALIKSKQEENKDKK